MIGPESAPRNRSVLEWGIALWHRELETGLQRLAELPSREAQRCAEVLRNRRDDADRITGALLRRANLQRNAWKPDDLAILDSFDSAMALPSSTELRRDPTARHPAPRKIRRAVLARCAAILGAPVHESGSTLFFEKVEGAARITTTVVCGGRLVDPHYNFSVFAATPDDAGWHRPLLSGISFLHLLGLHGYTVFNLMSEGDEVTVAEFIASDAADFFADFSDYLLAAES